VLPEPDGAEPLGVVAFGTLAGIVDCALVNGMLTGPLPITRAAATDTAAATELTEAIQRSRRNKVRRVCAAAAAAADAAIMAAIRPG
jgi:hypothetical protein